MGVNSERIVPILEVMKVANYENVENMVVLPCHKTYIGLAVPPQFVMVITVKSQYLKQSDISKY